MSIPRVQHTATLLNNGKVLVTGGTAGTSAELYDPATGTFTVTGSLTTARVGQTATLLSNGTVLVAAGDNPTTGPLASAELYDPTTGTFAATGSMTTARSGQTATLLNNGTVLVAAGVNSVGYLAGAELYDPATGTFTVTGSLTNARYDHSATLLNNGTVLVAGGYYPTSGQLTSAELYDPATGAFTVTGSLAIPRMQHTATLLNNGTVLVTGGNYDSNALASAELYEPVSVFPTNLSFSNQPIGMTSASQTVTLTNNESAALTVMNITISGTNASGFAENDNCVGNVRAGASCSINVTFTPAALGNQTGSLAIANNLASSPLTVGLAGTGVATSQIASLSGSSLTFGSQMIGTTSAPQLVTLSNTGNEPLVISNLSINGTNGSDFAETDNCIGSLSAGANCSINVSFAPTATGTRTGTLMISDNATSPQSPQIVALTGTGAAPLVSVSPSSITFANQYVGTIGLPQTVTITNNGNGALNITGITASPADFGLLSACGNTLAAGSSCAVGVFFDPTVGGTRTGTLTVADNGYFVPATASTALAFYPVTPCRVADTRNATGALGGPSLVGGQVRSFPVLSACSIPSGAQAYSLNFTAIPQGTLGYLSVWPTGQTQPLASALNAPTGTVTANAAVVPAGTNGAIDAYVTNNTDLVIDINGYFAPAGPGGLSLYTLTPCRVLDTRVGGSQPFSGTLNVNVTGSGCGAPSSAQAYVFNATVVPPSALGYVTLWPQGATQPLVSTLNALDGSLTSNMAIVPAASGAVSAYASNPTQLILDISGYFAP
jgi:hypothetical protein